MKSMTMVILFKNLVDSAVIMIHHVCLDDEVVHDVTNGLCVAKKEFLGNISAQMQSEGMEDIFCFEIDTVNFDCID